MKLWIVVALIGCGSESTPRTQTRDARLVARDAEAPRAVELPDAPPDAEVSTMRLPAKRVLASDVLGKSRAAVRALVTKWAPRAPHMEPGDGFIMEGSATVRVEYDERGTAVLISVIGDSDMTTTDKEQREALSWLGVDEDKATWLYDESLHEVVVWAEGAKERADERVRIAQALSDYMKRIGAGYGVARGDVKTVMLIEPGYKKPCTAQVLANYRRELEADAQVSFAKLGFVKMQCSLDGPSIPIR
jgi:hypothetical protein